jgi:hypothetical protein
MRRVSPPMCRIDLSQATIHLTPSDRIVETRRKNGCVKKFEDAREVQARCPFQLAFWLPE